MKVFQFREGNNFNPIESLKMQAEPNGDGNKMHPIISYPDGTEIVCSPVYSNGTVDVIMESPAYGGFKRAVLSLPSFSWKERYWYSEKELHDFEEYIREVEEVIFEIAQED